MLNAHENELSLRWDRLERANWLFRRIIFLFFAGVALLLTAWNQCEELPKAIASGCFQLQSKDGTMLAMFDNIFGDTPALGFYHSDGNPRSSFGTMNGGETNLLFYDNALNSLIELHVLPESNVVLEFFSKEDKSRGCLGETENGQMGLAFRAKGGVNQINLIVQADGMPALNVYDPFEKQRGTLSLTPEGDMLLNLADPDGTDRLELEIRAGLPSLDLLDPNRFRLFSVPQP